jgi:hypothetical protein
MIFVGESEKSYARAILGMQQISSKIWIWDLGLDLYVYVGIWFRFAFQLNLKD